MGNLLEWTAKELPDICEMSEHIVTRTKQWAESVDKYVQSVSVVDRGDVLYLIVHADFSRDAVIRWNGWYPSEFSVNFLVGAPNNSEHYLGSLQEVFDLMEEILPIY